MQQIAELPAIPQVPDQKVWRRLDKDRWELPETRWGLAQGNSFY